MLNNFNNTVQFSASYLNLIYCFKTERCTTYSILSISVKPFAVNVLHFYYKKFDNICDNGDYRLGENFQ